MKKADIILIAVVLLLAGAMFVFLYGGDKSGSFVQLEVDGEVVEVLDLKTDTTRVIETENGGANTFVIKDGTVKMTEANCPDGICKNHKQISRNGESIICLPHKVVITVINDKGGNDDIDAVA